MKQILQQFTLRASLLVMLLVGAIGSAWGEEVIKTLDLTAKTTNMQSYTGTFNWGEDWSLYGCANNNGQWAYVRFGGKASTSTETKTGASTITAKTAINSPLNEIKISHNGISKSNCTIKSVVLSVASDANYNNIIKTITLNPTLAVATKGTFSFTDNFASNSFYKITINWSVKGTTNCGLDIYTVEFIKETETESVATPTFTPAEGTYTSAQNVTISTTTDGATVYYTTDGTDPSTSSSVYSSPINVSQTTTIKAIAVKGMDNSAVAEATYTINIPETNVNWVETSLADLTTSDVFVIVGNTYAMTNNNGTESAPVAVSVTIADGKITSIVDDNMKWTISGNATDGYTFYPNGSTTTWLYCNTTAGSSSNNNMRVGTGDRKLFKPNNNGYFVTNDTYTARYISIYNNSDWRGYTSTSNGAVALKFYKRVSANEPTLTASDVEMEYNATSGNIAYTLENTTGGTMSAETTADWLTIGTVGETIPFTCDANSTASERTATVTLTYTLTSGGTLTATATVTQAANPNAVSTIAEVRSQGTGSVQTKGVVTSVNGKTAYIQDATAAIAVYNSAAELTVAVGDEIKVSGTLGTYNGLLQIQSPTINVISNGNTVTPEVMTISQVNASNNQGWLVKIEEAKVTEITDKNVTIAQGENTIVVRFNNTEDITVTENDIITLTGNIGCFNTTKQIANPTDIVKKELVTVTLTFNDVPSTIVINESATYAATANPAVTGITYQSSDEDVVMVDANTGEIAALALGTATITASYVGDDDYKSATASYTIEVVAAQHTAKFFVNGEEQTEAEAQVAEGAAITFPEATPSIEGKTFVGWTTAAIDGETDEAPAVLVTSATMGIADVTYYAVYATQEGEGGSSTATLTSANIKASYVDPNGYANRTISDGEGNTWHAYAMSSKHSNATSDYYYLQIKKSDASQSYYIQVPQFGAKITGLIMTVSNSNKPMTDGGNTATLFFSASNTTSAAGEGVVSGTGDKSVTLDCSSLDLNTGYITAGGAVRIWDVTVTYGTPASYTGYCTTVSQPEPEAYAVVSTNGTSVTFYYDGNKATREGTKYDITDGSTHEWVDNNNSTLTTATFDPSFSRYSGLTTLSRWFFECQQLQTITGLEHLNTENVTDMYQLFRYCQKLKSLDLSNFNTGKVTRMIEMFGFCTGLENITLGANFSTENVVYMQSMFTNCMKLMSVDVSGFNTEKVTNMSGMFWDCEAMTSIDVSSFNTANVTNMSSMFGECGKLVTIYVGDNWNTEKVSSINSANMFTASTKIVGGNGTTYNYNYTSKTYGRIDGNGGAGYLSHKTKKYVTVGSAGYTTFVPTANVSLAEGVEAYGVDEIKESSMHLLPIETAVPSGEAVVIKAAEGVYALPIVESATAVSGNLLQASDGNVTGDGSTIYALGNKSAGVGFYPVKSGATVPAGKAYLEVSDDNIKEFISFDFGGLVTEINKVNADVDANAKIYNLAGQRVQKVQKGFYIVGGKKVMVK